jgi:mannose-6-phosphate isomerase-like protein (cupin superfamily)
MSARWKYVRLEDVPLSDLGNGFSGANIIGPDGFELTFVTAAEGSGHDFHRHEDLDEILIFLEGECSFNVDGKDIDIKGGSLLFVPGGADHKVRYKRKSKVIRMKLSKSSNR